jgi:hypothetical protein
MCLNRMLSLIVSQGKHGFLTETLYAVDNILSFIKHLGWRPKSLGTSFGRLCCQAECVQSQSNGLSYLIDHFKGQSLYGHVNLEKGERSELAELASNLL